MAYRASEKGKGQQARRFWIHAGIVGVLLCPLAAGVCQVAPGFQGVPISPTPQASPNRPGLGSDPLGLPDPSGMPNPRKLEHMREEERHKRLEADTARLVELTNELKAEVDKTSKDELSVNVVKKAAEIEKLAHDVKERMKS